MKELTSVSQLRNVKHYAMTHCGAEIIHHRLGIGVYYVNLHQFLENWVPVTISQCI
jgi:hypothetical protein